MKKLISFILSIALLLGTTAGLDFSANALSSSGSCGKNVTYTFDSSTGTLTISGTGNMNDYNTSVSPFENQSSIKSVVINSGVKSIGSSAFHSCSGLTSIEIPSSVTTIGGSAFYHCSGLTSIEIPDSVTSIGNNAFDACSGLISITIGNRVTSISFAAFENCSSLTNIEIPNSVTSIGDYAFIRCYNLSNVAINNGTKSIGNYAFDSCGKLKRVTIPNSVTSIGYRAFPYINTIASTCNNNAVKSYVNNSNSNIAWDKSHTEVIDETVEPTCTQTGLTEGKHCSACDEVLVKQEVVDALGHTPAEAVMENESASTCSTEGSFDEVIYCSVCNEELSRETKPIEKAPHTYSSVVTHPTCIEQGYTTHTCSRCSDSYIDEYTVELGHNYESVVTEPTCTEQGYTTHTCNRCRDSYVDDYTDELGHNYESVVTAPTCTEQGYTTHTCSRCGDSYIEEYTDELGHNYEPVVTAPTCTEQGYTTHTCTRCGDSYKDSFVTELGHNWTSWSIANAPYGCKNGLSMRICNTCNEIDYLVIPTVDTHSYIPTVTKNASCIEEGEIRYTCNICGDSYTEKTPKISHTAVKDSAVTPTCEKTGLTEGSHCTVCGEILVEQQMIPISDHTPETDEAVLPTCEKTGLTEGSHCSVCGKVITAQEVVKANGHSYEAVVNEPTCLSRGYTTYTCTVCGDSYRGDYVSASDEHEYRSAVTKLPTCSELGVRTYTCTICGDKYVEDVEMLEHTPVKDKAVAATFSAAGKTEGSHCKVCGTVLVAQKTVAKLGAPTISGLTAQSKGFKVTWKSVANIDGYEIRYATSTSALSKAKPVAVSGYKSTSKTITKLTGKKKYYVQIRAYKTINGKKQYSAWSKSKYVTTKK